MQRVTTISFVLLLSIIGISTAQQNPPPNRLQEPQMLASTVKSNNKDNHLFVIKRSLPGWLRYSLMRYSIVDGSVIENAAILWANSVPYNPNQPAMNPSVAVDVDMDPEGKFLYIIMCKSRFSPDVEIEVYRVDPDAKPIQPKPDSRPWVEPFANHRLEHSVANVPCGVESVRLIAGRSKLRFFITRTDSECGEEEIRYNLTTGEWTPES